MVLNAVLDDRADRHGNGAGDEAGQCLEESIGHRVMLVIAAAGVDDGDDEGLQKIAAQQAANGAGKTMPNRPEAMFVHGCGGCVRLH